MNDVLSKTNILRLYFKAHHVTDKSIAEKTGFRFGNVKFMESNTQLDDEKAMQMAEAFEVPEKIMKDGSRENMINNGLLNAGKDRFYYAILRSGMTPVEAGRKSGCGMKNVNALLDGTDRPTKPQLQQLARALNTTYGFLVYGIDDDSGGEMESDDDAWHKDIAETEDGTEHNDNEKTDENNAEPEDTKNREKKEMENEQLNSAALSLVLKNRGLSEEDIPGIPQGKNPMVTHQQKRDIARKLSVNPGILNMDVTLWELSDLGLFTTMSQRISYLAERSGLTCSEIAQKTQLSAKTLREHLDGKHSQMTMSYLIKLSDLFMVTPGFIRYGSTSERTDVFWYQLGRLMTERSVNRNELSQSSGIDSERIKSMLRGLLLPKDNELKQIAFYFGVTPEYFSMVQLRPDGMFTDEKRYKAKKHPITWKNSGTVLSGIIQDTGISEGELAIKCGVPAMAVSRYANGKTYTSNDAKYKQKIADALGMDCSELFPEDQVQNNTEKKSASDTKKCGNIEQHSGDGTDCETVQTDSASVKDEKNSGISEDKRTDKPTVGQVMTMVWDRNVEDWDAIIRCIDGIRNIRADSDNGNRDAVELILKMDSSDLDLLEEQIKLLSNIRKSYKVN